MPSIRSITGGEAGALSQGPPWSKTVLHITFVCEVCGHAWEMDIKGNQIGTLGTYSWEYVTDTHGLNPGTVIKGKLVTDSLQCPSCSADLLMEIQAHDEGGIIVSDVGSVPDNWWVIDDTA